MDTAWSPAQATIGSPPREWGQPLGEADLCPTDGARRGSPPREWGQRRTLNASTMFDPTGWGSGSPPREWGQRAPGKLVPARTVHPHASGDSGTAGFAHRHCRDGSPPREWGQLRPGRHNGKVLTPTRPSQGLRAFFLVVRTPSVHPHASGASFNSGSPPREWGQLGLAVLGRCI